MTTTKQHAFKQHGFAIGYVLVGLVLAGILGSLFIGSIANAKTSTDSLGKKMTTREYAKSAIMTIRTSMLYESSTRLPEPISEKEAIEGGGLLPEVYEVRTTDGYERAYSYCVNQSAGKGQGRMAVVSAGANGTYETDCERALKGEAASDDIGAVAVDAEINDLVRVQGGTA